MANNSIGAQLLLLIQAAESEVAAEVTHAGVVQGLDLCGALIRSADECAVLGKILVGRREFSAAFPVGINALVDFAADRELAPPGIDVEGPVQGFTRVAVGLLFSLGHVEVAEEWNVGWQRGVSAGLCLLQKAPQQIHGGVGVQDDANDEPASGGGDELQRLEAARRGDIDRRVRLLQRGRHKVEVLRRIVAPLERAVGSSPQGFHHLDGLPIAGLALGVVDAKVAILRA